MTLHYMLAEACKNTFILVDMLDDIALNLAQQQCIHERLVREQCDDAIILLNGQAYQPDMYQANMIVLGVDGQLGAFCGNGSRACAAYLFKHYSQFKRFFIHANNTHYELLKYNDDLYATQLHSVNFEPNLAYIRLQNISSHTYKNTVPQARQHYFHYSFQDKILYYADAIEPHLILNERIHDDELIKLAQQINQQTDVFPQGINITAYYAQDAQTLCAKTYERGVQRLTQSCGTGATCATAFHLQEKIGRVTVMNPGGVLTITKQSNRIELKGPASITHSLTVTAYKTT